MSTLKKVIELPPLDVAGKEIFTLYSILKSLNKAGFVMILRHPL